MEKPARFLGASFVLIVGAALGCTVTPSKPADAPKDSSAADPESKAPLPPVEAERVADGEAAPGDAATSAKRKSFDSMSAPERMTFMKKVVLPEMSELFEAGGEDDNGFTCRNCHGSRAAQGDFSMPNPELPKLDPSDGFADEKKEHPAAVKFMMEQVVPKMAELLGEPIYDPKTNKGFGCFECHTKADP